MQAPATAISRAESFPVLGFGEVAPRGKTLRRVRNVSGRHPPLPRHTPGANSAAVSREQMCFILTCPKTAMGYFSNSPNRSVCGSWNGGGGRRAMEQVHGFWKWGRANARANKRPVGLGDIQLPRSIFLHSLTSGVYATKPCEAGRRSTEHKGLRHCPPSAE